MIIAPKHKARMFEVLSLIQKWSDCPDGRQHACLIALKGKYIVATGYNGNFKPCGISGACATLSREDMRKACKAVHAEVNACLNLFMDLKHREDAVAFVTKRPCDKCLKALEENNIKHVFWREMRDWHIIDEGDFAI